MGGSRKSRNSAVAPIFRQKAEKAQAPSLEHSPSDSDSEMSSQAASDRAEAPLTRRDMKGFLADIRKSVAEELDKKLGPIMEGMADLSARTQATETKMAEAMETVQAHGGELQALREQLRSLEESNEDLNNRSRRNNIRSCRAAEARCRTQLGPKPPAQQEHQPDTRTCTIHLFRPQNDPALRAYLHKRATGSDHPTDTGTATTTETALTMRTPSPLEPYRLKTIRHHDGQIIYGWTLDSGPQVLQGRHT
ncbi:Hypothetical predicted protein [Pelobates cultripes]|uniref:Uncharacterized protein n=1 Tax=Pelobates cultripes TaxID=61616 RepID=A0AAD1VLT2_PELCU|nr:Hypothetical predicted protein [Pelobates cultripes]